MNVQPQHKIGSAFAVFAISVMALASGFAVVNGIDIARFIPILLMVLAGGTAYIVVEATRPTRAASAPSRPAIVSNISARR
ncbi:MAG: hypothetical protein JWQ43_3651 [Glaciihabitans sp.]|nr:hypothetical protein [Glaciihabitans sp.]